MMPLPVLMASAILLGWPLLKLVATLISRPIWRRFQELSTQLKQDDSYGEAERALIDIKLKEAKGEPLQILMPIFVFAGGIAFAFAHPFSAFGQRSAAESADRHVEPESVDELRRELSDLESRMAKLGLELMRAPPRNSPLWSDSRFKMLEDISFRLSLLRYPVASLLTGVAALVVSPLIFASEGLRASAWPVVRRLVHSSAYSSRVFARSVGVIS